MKGYRLRGNERGSVLLFMLGTLFFLLVFGGFAIDLAFLSTTKGELQRSMDASALAGAGQLGFNDSVFPTVRQEAGRFADLNPSRVGAVTLDPNPANDPNGDIVLGVWDGATFTPSLDGIQVNAVSTQYATEVPTSFLRILGFNTLPVSARAIAVANPAANPPANACVVPIGASGCGFQDGGASSSQGCGEPISFISSSQGEPTAGTNSAAWMNFVPAPPECDLELDPECVEEQFGWTEYLNNAINDMADNTCETSTASVGDVTATNNGLIQNVVNTLEAAFVQNYNPGIPITVTNASDEVVYSGGGWELTAAVIETDCPEPGAISGDHNIIGWTKFVMTQVINHGDCAVLNSDDTISYELCPPPMNPMGPPRTPSLRAIYGYFSCDLIQSTPTSDPAPRSSIASGRKLVQ